MKVLLLKNSLTGKEYLEIIKKHKAIFQPAMYVKSDLEDYYKSVKHQKVLILPSSTYFFDVLWVDSKEEIKNTFRTIEGATFNDGGELKELTDKQIEYIWELGDSFQTSFLLQDLNLW